MKCVVYGIYILKLIQSVLIIYSGFQTFVPGFGDVEALNRVDAGWLSIPILTVMGKLSWIRGHRLQLLTILISYQVTFIVQAFYAHRIYILAKTKKVAGAIIAVSCRERSSPFKTWTPSKYCIIHSFPLFNFVGGYHLGFTLCWGNITPCLLLPIIRSSRRPLLGYEQLPHKFVLNYLIAPPYRYGSLGVFFAILPLPCAWPITYVFQISPFCLREQTKSHFSFTVAAFTIWFYH